MSKIIEYKEIPLSELVISKENIRKKEIPPLGEFEESIKDRGVLEPIIVRKKGDRYEVVAGQLRFIASKELGLKKIPTIVKELTDNEALIESLIENVSKNELNPDEEVNAVVKLYKIYKSERKVAQILGKSHPWVNDRLKAKELIDILKSDGQQLTTTTKHIAKSADISRVVTDIWKPKKVVEFIEEVKDKPREEVKRILNHVKNEPEKEVKEILKDARREQLRMLLQLEFPTSIGNGILKCAKDRGIDRKDVIMIAVEQWLKKEGYLD